MTKTLRLAVTELIPFGVLVDFDLTRPIDEAVRDELRTLYARHKLLLFRGQEMDEEHHAAIISLFDRVLGSRGEYREVSSDGNLGAGPLAFHSDLAFSEAPFRLISLFAKDVNDGQSWTAFANGVQSAARLPARLRERLAGRDAVTAISIVQSHRDIAFSPPDYLPQQRRPVIMPHPRTGEPILYISEMQTARIDGMDQVESDALLQELFAVLYAPEHVYRHYWNRGDLLIWDNFALQHARCDLAGMTPRRLQRIVAADRSFFELFPQFDLKDPRIAAWASGEKLTIE